MGTEGNLSEVVFTDLIPPQRNLPDLGLAEACHPHDEVTLCVLILHLFWSLDLRGTLLLRVI